MKYISAELRDVFVEIATPPEIEEGHEFPEEALSDGEDDSDYEEDFPELPVNDVYNRKLRKYYNI